MSGIGPITTGPAAKVTSLAAAAPAATIVTQFNALLTSLKAAGIMLSERYAPLFKSMGPLFYLRYGEAVPGTGTAVDEMGAHNGTYVASPTTAAGLLAGDGNPGVTFNGSSQYVNMGNAFILAALPNSSLVILFNSGALTGNDRTLYCERSDANSIWKLGIQMTTGRPNFAHRDNAGTIDQLSPSGGTYANNGTHMFVVTKAGTAIVIYADGSPIKTGTLAGTDTLSDGTKYVDFAYDAPVGGEFFPGVLDDSGGFARTLSPAEVTALWAAATT